MPSAEDVIYQGFQTAAELIEHGRPRRFAVPIAPSARALMACTPSASWHLWFLERINSYGLQALFASASREPFLSGLCVTGANRL